MSHSAANVLRLFQDADKSDYVDAQEFKSIFSDIGEKHSDDRMAEIDSIRDRGDSDGRLSSNEFCEFMVEYFADLTDRTFLEKIKQFEDHLAQSHRKLLLRRVFVRMDADKSGSVSLEEFKALGDENVGADQSTAFFKWIEGALGNADGELTADEWVPFVLEMEEGTTDEEFQQLVDDWMDILERKRRLTILKTVFSKMDADMSGEVDLEEFSNLEDGETGELGLETVFRYLDENYGDGDGVVSLDEWLLGMRKMSEDMNEDEFEAEVAKWNRVLTANQRRMWRGCFSRGHAHSFVIAARAAGATHVLFVVHAHTAGESVATPALATGGSVYASGAREVDLRRHLTTRGTAQCMIARIEWFGRLPVRTTILCSPAKRTKETAMHMSGQAETSFAEGEDPLLLIEALHPIGQSNLAEEIHFQKGDGALRLYLDADGGETAFGRYAEAACEELAAKFRSNNEQRETATYVSCVGHAGFLNAVAHAVATAAGIEDGQLDEMLDIHLGEAEGILVPLYGKGKGAIHLKRPA